MHVDGPNLASLPVAAAYPQYTLVKLASGKATACAATDANAIGYTARETFAVDAKVAIILLSKEGTQRARAAGSFNAGVEVFQAAAGELDDSGSIRRGVALTASGGADDWFVYVETPNGAGEAN